eukprot:TRINITY_DN7248_c0_g1_i1.p1 TRINITY_DN7248_c0_g1~~TRINITY_DN7248_c0_g1_i1.p1  ORF type:complete len:370 (-),score=38.13 TRINITY_DN7248_c0_g1_i1:227-1336(-)
MFAIESTSSAAELVAKIVAIAKVNAEIVASIEDHSKQNREVVRGVRFNIGPSTDGNLPSVTPNAYSSYSSTIIASWAPAATAPAFEKGAELNLFNDNIDYSVRSYEDVKRLSNTVHIVAQKYDFLDEKKSPPMLRKFLTNLEIIQTLLGDIQGRLTDYSDPMVEEIVKTDADLREKWAAHVNRIQTFNKTMLAALGPVSLDLATWKTPQPTTTISADGRTLTKTTVRHEAVSVAGIIGSTCSTEMLLRYQPLAGSHGWLLIGVHNNAPNASQGSYEDPGCWGFVVSVRAAINYIAHTHQGGKQVVSNVDTRSDGGAIIKATVDLASSTLTLSEAGQPGWTTSMQLPVSPENKWRFHFNLCAAGFVLNEA